MPMINLKICLILFLMYSGFCIFPRDKDYTLEISAGLLPVSLMDENFSTVVYFGTPMCLGIGYAAETPRYRDATEFKYIQGKIDSASGSGNSLNETSFQYLALDWYHVRRLYSSEKYSFLLYLGGDLNSSYAGYQKIGFSGAETYYTYQSSLGPILYMVKDLSLKGKKFSIEGLLGCSLAAYTIFPAYGSILPASLYDKDVNEVGFIEKIGAGEFLFADKFQRANIGVNLVFLPGASMLVKTGYQWELMHHKRETDYYMVRHSITVSLIFGKGV